MVLLLKNKINQNPLVYIYDTPGVLEPVFENIETGFKLACLSIKLKKSYNFFKIIDKDCLKNHAVNSDILADYLLFKLNKSSNFKYFELF